MIKCLICGVGYNLAGIETYAITQLLFLNKEQYHFDFVYALKEKEIAFKEEILSAGSLIYNIRNSHEWKSFLKEHGTEYNIIIFNTPFPTFLPILKCHKYKNLKIIVHSHNSQNDNPWYYRMFTGLSLAYLRAKMHFAKVEKWACSEPAGQFMFGKKSRFTVIKNAIDIEKFIFSEKNRKKIRDVYNINPNTVVIGHIGRFDYQKNHELTLASFFEYNKKNPDSVLWFIGPETRIEISEHIHTQVRKYGIEDKVHFLGPIENVNEYYQAMDIFFLPSLFEGLGIVAIEAQAADLPCLISDTFPNDVEITDKLIKCKLTSPIEEWVDKLCLLEIKAKKSERRNNKKVITQAGFNINTEIRRVENLLTDLAK